MPGKHNNNDDKDGNDQKGDDNPQPVIGRHSQVIRFKGKLVNLRIAELVQPRLNFFPG